MSNVSGTLATAANSICIDIVLNRTLVDIRLLPRPYRIHAASPWVCLSIRSIFTPLWLPDYVKIWRHSQNRNLLFHSSKIFLGVWGNVAGDNDFPSLNQQLLQRRSQTHTAIVTRTNVLLCQILVSFSISWTQQASKVVGPRIRPKITHLKRYKNWIGMRKYGNWPPYDMIRDASLTCNQKLTKVSLIYRTARNQQVKSGEVEKW